MLSDNPFLDLVGQTADMVAQEAEKKRQLAMLQRQQQLAWQQKLAEEQRKQEQERRKGALSYLLSAYRDESLTPESRKKAYELGLKMLSQGDVDVSGFTPEFKPPQTKPETYISGKVAKMLQIPEGPYTPDDAAKYVREYYDILSKQKRNGGGISISIGGKKVDRDFLLERLQGYRKELESILRGGVKVQGTSATGELQTLGADPGNAAEYLKMLDDLIFAVESGKLTDKQQEMILKEITSPYLRVLSQEELDQLDQNIGNLDFDLSRELEKLRRK